MDTVLLRNVNPLGYVDLPILGRFGPSDDDTADQAGVGCLYPGEKFECPADIAGHGPTEAVPAKGEPGADDYEPAVPADLGEGLLAQVGNYELVTDDPLSKMTIPELEAYAADKGIDLTGKTKKAQILRAIKASS